MNIVLPTSLFLSKSNNHWWSFVHNRLRKLKGRWTHGLRRRRKGLSKRSCHRIWNHRRHSVSQTHCTLKETRKPRLMPLWLSPRIFTFLYGETTKVPFMKERNIYYWYGKFEDFKLLQLRYESGQDTNNKFSMYTFLPKETQGLEDLLKKFHSFPHMRQPEGVSCLWIPKMKFSYSFEPNKLMEAEGLTLPFDRDDADFLKMVYSPQRFCRSLSSQGL